jgi:hypothetical protein
MCNASNSPRKPITGFPCPHVTIKQVGISAIPYSILKPSSSRALIRIEDDLSSR